MQRLAQHLPASRRQGIAPMLAAAQHAGSAQSPHAEAAHSTAWEGAMET